MNEYVAGSTSVVDTIFLQDSASTTGGGKTGLAYNTGSLTCYYKRSNGTASVAVTLADISTLGTFVSGGFKAIDGTNMPGLYEFHPPDAAFASGAKEVTFFFTGASGLVMRPIKYRILACNLDDSVRGGMTALPNAAANANGGLPILSSSGTTLAYTLSTLTTLTGGVNVTQWLGAACHAVNTAGYPVVDLVLVNGTAASATSGAVDANVTKWDGSTVATADTAGYPKVTIKDGTGAGEIDLRAGSIASVDAVETVYALGSGAITAPAISDNAITTAKIAANAIGASQLATDAVTEIWAVAVPGAFSSGSAGNTLGNIATGTPPTAGAIADAVWDEATSGHVAAGSFGLANGTGGGGLDAAGVRAAIGMASANLDTQLAALFTTAMTESYAADGSPPSPAQALFLILQRMTEFAISGTTITVKKLDGSTTAATLTLDSATAPTSSTRAS